MLRRYRILLSMILIGCGCTQAIADTSTTIVDWQADCPMFLSDYGNGQYDFWAGHGAVLKKTFNPPAIYVLGGAPNTFNACADGNLSSPFPSAYSTVYHANINADGSIQTWSADVGEQLPLATILHSTVLAMNDQIYVIAGINSMNAGIFGGARSLSVTADPSDYVGRAHVFYENVISGYAFKETSFIPIRDPAWLANTVTPVYQPLVRAAAVSYNDVIYVIGGISRQNIGPVLGPTGSVAVYENRVWYCSPTATGSISREFQPNSWETTTSLPIPLYDTAACAVNGRLYVLGGRDSAGNPQNTVLMTIINPDGSLGSWQTTTSLPEVRAEHSAVFTGIKLYILAGSSDTSGGALADTVYTCQPDPGTGLIPALGQPGTWSTQDAALPFAMAGQATTASSSGVIYVLGGRHTTTTGSNVYHSAFPTPTSSPTPTISPTMTITATPTPPMVANGKVLIYPNPAYNQVRFAWSADEVECVAINIYNVVGERVAHLQFQKPGQTVIWKTQGMVPGLYFYEITLTIYGQQNKHYGKIALIGKGV